MEAFTADELNAAPITFGAGSWRRRVDKGGRTTPNLDNHTQVQQMLAKTYEAVVLYVS